MAGIVSGSTRNTSLQTKKGYKSAFAIVTLLFFMWGFITCMNDILIPYLKDVFALSYFQAMLIQFAFFGAYFVGSLIYFFISMLYGDPIAKMGYKNGIILGLVISAIGCALFIPAASYLIYGFFLGALFCLGLGLTVLQIAANPYVAILGSSKTASSRLNLAQGFNSFGYTIAPVIGGYLIFSSLGGKDIIGADALKIPYLGLSMLFLLLAAVIKFYPLPIVTESESVEKGAGALKHRHLVFGMIAIFMYVGGEVSIGSLLVNFFGLPEIAGLEEIAASAFLSFYWGGTMIGRFLGAISLSNIEAGKKFGLMAITAIATFFVIYGVVYLNTGISLQEISPFLIFIGLNLLAFRFGNSNPQRTLAIFSGIVIVLLTIVILTSGKVAFWSVIAIGLFNSIMWSNVFTLAISGLGKYTSQASSLLVMAILGGALVPLVQGVLADAIGIQMSFALPIVCYAFLGYYGLKGYKPIEIIQ
tara:strand:- start:42268 stop:43689 length:1422 start_codon:yes stop_codon:yes gene_type:complete